MNALRAPGLTLILLGVSVATGGLLILNGAGSIRPDPILVVLLVVAADLATVAADVMIRVLLDEASATGDLGDLGETRIVRIVISDAAGGDLAFP